jgi:hypothetical protein
MVYLLRDNSGKELKRWKSKPRPKAVCRLLVILDSRNIASSADQIVSPVVLSNLGCTFNRVYHRNSFGTWVGPVEYLGNTFTGGLLMSKKYTELTINEVEIIQEGRRFDGIRSIHRRLGKGNLKKAKLLADAVTADVRQTR